MLDLNHGSGFVPGRISGGAPAPVDIGIAVTAAIDAGMEREANQYTSSGKRRIGAASLGDPCARKLHYRYLRVPGTPPAGRMRRIWERGHEAERRIIRWLRLAGFAVVAVDPKTGQQIGLSQLDGRIAGRIDGVITAGPVELPYPVLLELKCLNARGWSDLVKHGLAVSKEVYNAQIHLYMAYLELSHCLFGAENADSQELWWNLIPFDQAEAQRVSDRGVQVVQMGDAGELPPRIAAAPDFWLCKMCEHAALCWSSNR